MTFTTRTAILRAVMLGATALTLTATIATPAAAQLTTSTIRGTVSSGAKLSPGTTVTAINVDTNAATHATAGADGAYVLTGLSPGT